MQNRQWILSLSQLILNDSPDPLPGLPLVDVSVEADVHFLLLAGKAGRVAGS